MHIKRSQIQSILLISLCFTSLVYFNQKNDMFDFIDPSISDFTDQIENINPDINDFEDIPDSPDTSSLPVKKVDTPGSYQLQAYFFHNDELDIDDDGLGWELDEYDDMKDDGANSASIRPRFDSTGSSEYEHTMPPDTVNYYEFTSPYSPYSKSHYFTPVFTEETYLSGKIYFITHIKNDYSTAFPTIDFRIRLFSFNPADNSTDLICTIEDNGIDYYMSASDHRPYSFTLPSTYTVPVGHRLKIKLDGKISTLAETGEFKIYNSDSGSGYTWDVVDGIYTASYSITDIDRVFGVQFYMNNDYPEITVSGLRNDAVSHIKRNVSINVAGAVTSSYRWDGVPYTFFDTNTWFWSPETHGWHQLDIQAIDDYGNNRTIKFNFGIDESTLNLELTSPTNGSLIGDSTILYFNNYSISYALYEWDKDGNILNLTDNGYIIQDSLSGGEHNLTVTTYDVFETEDFFYIFQYDADPPSVNLLSPDNDSVQPAGKVIDVSITDDTSLDVQYKWDSQDQLTWPPFSGDIYRTYLPGLDGEHFLYLYVNDSFGHYLEVTYRFETDNSVLGVELQNLINNSHYFGGNVVNLTITGSNDSVYYSWDNGAESYVDLDGSTFYLLTGGDVLPPFAGMHNLTIRTFDISDFESIFFFNFTVDQEAPTIDSSIYDNDNERFKTSDSFVFILDDNNSTLSELTVFYTIDGGEDIYLNVPFGLDLEFFTDGTYVLTLYVYDIAANLATASFTFTIDETPPTIDDYDIGGLVQVLGINYVPKDSLVTFTFSDDDVITSTYSWDAGSYIPFTNSFNLDYSDGFGILYVNASDSLDNHVLFTVNLTIDSIAPEISITSPRNYSKINHFAELNFLAKDSIVQTIKKVEISWDIFYPFSTTVDFDSLGHFDMFLHPVYGEGIALLYITAEDIVGNSKNYTFEFTVDLTAPTAAFYIDDPNTPELDYKDASDPAFDYVRGNTSIWYNASENTDLATIFYYFDNDAEESQLLLSSPWIYIPQDDGQHNLTVILTDDTEGSQPNKFEYVYFFYVDDIKIIALPPYEVDNSTYELTYDENAIHEIVYGDSFNFTLRITDFFNDTAISNLFWNQTRLSLSNNLNLTITNNTINDYTFQFFVDTITATKVDSTILVFEFSRAGSSQHYVFVSLSLLRKQGYIQILGSSSSDAIYEQELLIQISLNNEIGSKLNISEIYVNGTKISEFSHLGSSIFEFSYSSYQTPGKGNYSLEILALSTYYLGQTNSSYTFEFEILPLPTNLLIYVSEYNVTEGNNVIISGLLTYINGTPIENVDITFAIFVHYKEDSFGAQALTAGYDKIEYLTDKTNATGYASVSFLMTEDIEFIEVVANYSGSSINDEVNFELGEIIRSMKPPGLPTHILYIIIASAVVFVGIASFIIYKFVKQKPFEQLMEEIEELEILDKLDEINPGVVVIIFDQRRGAVPLVTSHALNKSNYSQRFTVGLDNFLLKISDQAFSSLGFEEQHEKRRIGSIILPSESMVGLIHGIQLENKLARGGFENLALIVLVNEQHDNALLGNQVYLYDEIDVLISKLKEEQQLGEITNQLVEIRKKVTRIVLAAIQNDKDLSD